MEDSKLTSKVTEIKEPLDSNKIFILNEFLTNLENYENYNFNEDQYGFERSMHSTSLFIQSKIFESCIIFNDIISDLNVFSENVAINMWEYLINNYYGYVLISELDLMKNHLPGYRKLTSKKFIIDVTNSREWINYFYEKYPVLIKIVSTFIEEQLKFLIEIIKNVANDLLKLESTFKSTYKKLKLIELLKGDPHNSGKSVSFLVFDDDKKLVYKPRKMEHEVNISKTLLANNLQANFPISLCKKDYGYTEFIERSSTKSEISLENSGLYFYKMGINTKVLNTFQIEDIISDNVIWNGDNPSIIDIECFQIPPISIETGFREIFRYYDLSPVQTGMISNKFGKKEYNMSLLFENNHYQIDLPRYLKNLISELNEIEILERLNGKKNQHLPVNYVFDKEYLTYYLEQFIEGYQSVNSFSLIERKDVKTRIILRETQTYFDILISSKQPECLVSIENYKSFLAIILVKENGTEIEKTISNDEFRQMLEGHIPIFYIENENLLNDKGDILVSNFYKTESRFINFEQKPNYSTFLKEYILNKLDDSQYFTYFFKEISDLSLKKIYN
jgi:lantibiotic modifying enzyme